jgi:hypothetical protein
MCCMSGDPLWDDYTICAAVAPMAILAVRRYGKRPLYDCGLVRRFAHREPRTSSSTR